MEPITIRISEELQAKLDVQRGDEKKSDFYRRVFEEWLITQENTKHQNQITIVAAQNEGLKSENALLRDSLSYLQGKLDDSTKKLDDAMRLLHQEQTMHLQIQRLLPVPETEPVAPDKKWWEFWRR